jgi:threonyl-tRNA synthetase
LRVLFIHSGETWFKAVRKALDEPPDPPSEAELGECLVAFVSVEEGDTIDEARSLVEDAMTQARRVGADCILVYPFAHLSPKLANPREAYSLLLEIEKMLRERWEGRVERAPFGWYKSFRIHCVGHPLCELSREYRGRPDRFTAPDGRALTLADAEREGLIPSFTTSKWSEESLGVMKRFGLYPRATGLGAEIARGVMIHLLGGARDLVAEEAQPPSIPLRAPLPHIVARICLDALEQGSELTYRLPGLGEVKVLPSAELENLRHLFEGVDEGFRGEISELKVSRRNVGVNIEWYSDYEGVILYYTSPLNGHSTVVGAWVKGSSRSVGCIGPSYEIARSLVDYKIYTARKGVTPSLPFWANPVHVAIVPVKEGQTELAEELASRLATLSLRVYVDPPTRSLGARIRNAGRMWSLYVAVIGEREAAEGSVNVRRRREGDQVVMSMEEFVEDMTRMAVEPPSPLRPLEGLPTLQSSR